MLLFALRGTGQKKLFTKKSKKEELRVKYKKMRIGDTNEKFRRGIKIFSV